MPYFVHAKTLVIGPDDSYDAVIAVYRARTFTVFETRAQAFEFLKTEHSAETHTITFRASDSEMDDWKHREYYRFKDGEYVRVPWHERERPDIKKIHYAHLSIDKAGMVAYTPDVEAGVNDKQTRVTPGRYLERFYSDTFTREEIAAYVAEVSGSFSDFKLARTTEDIRKVYRGGPSSCMGGGPMHTDQYWNSANLDGHDPTDVYAAPSDLAVAYFGPIDHPSQRSVVWPERKTFQRIYGSGPLERLLRNAGYTNCDPSGARILNISVHGSYLMPYVDGCEHASYVSEQFLRLDFDGDIDTQVTRGYSGEDENSDDYISCDRCGAHVHVDLACGDYCESCDSERWYCDGCEETYFDNERCTSIGDGNYCRSCTRERTTECADEHCSHRWIEENEFSTDERDERARHDLKDLCRECASRYTWCDACEQAHDEETCPDCGRSPRCEKTIDLLLEGLAHDDRIGADENDLPCNCTYCNPAETHTFTIYPRDRSVLWQPPSGESIALDGVLSGLADALETADNDRPSMPFPHGLTIDQIASTEHEAF